MNTRTPVEKHFDNIAAKYNLYKKKNKYYYDNLKNLLKSRIPKNKKVFEVGCGTGDLIIHLDPSRGWGMDLSHEMVKIAKRNYGRKRKIEFSVSWPKGTFEYILMSDVIEHLENPLEVFNKISARMNKKSVFVMTMANPFWEPILLLAEELGFKMPEGPHKRIAFNDLRLMFSDSGMKIVEHGYRLLIPIEVPYITDFVNKYLEKYFKRLAFIEYFVIVKR